MEYWEHFTKETLQEGEATRQRSVALRGTLDAILNNAARDLRSQADKVDMALAKRVACTDEVRIRLENELKKVFKFSLKNLKFIKIIFIVKNIISSIITLYKKQEFFSIFIRVKPFENINTYIKTHKKS